MKLMLCGQMRSGTTFLSNLINAQPRVRVVPDFLQLHRLMLHVGATSLTEVLSNSQRYSVLSRFYGSSDGCAAIARDTDVLFELRAAVADFETLDGFYGLILEQLATAGENIVGHKITDSEAVVGQLLGLRPELKCICMIRDPRDVLLSTLRRRKTTSAVDVLERWQRGVETVEQLTADDSVAERLLVMRYEELMQRPQEQVQRMVDFLQLPDFVIPQQLEWHGQDYVSNSSFGDITKLFDTRGIGRWKENPQDRWISVLAQLVLGDGLRRYERESGQEETVLAAEEASRVVSMLRRSQQWWTGVSPLLHRLSNAMPNRMDRLLLRGLYEPSIVAGLEKHLNNPHRG